MDDPLVQALTRAVEAAPSDATLRAHLVEVLLGAGRGTEAISHCAVLLQADPADRRAADLMARALGAAPAAATAEPADPAPRSQAPGPDTHQPDTQQPDGQQPDSQPSGAQPDSQQPEAPHRPEPPQYGPPTGAPQTGPGRADHSSGFDWQAAEQDLDGIAEPMFVDESAAPDPGVSAWDVERSDLTLADVGGMEAVKDRLEVAFLAPLRNPDLRRAYGKSLRGGLLMYGPPGCGKTFIARAVAGEMGAKFISVGLSDILDQFIGNSERNISDLFRLARREAPVVLFLDEIDALGVKRSATRNSGMRGTVNQLLTELDGVDGANEGVFVLGATNQLWDVDPALRRPGRFDRTLLVVPPDQPAREAILRHHLRTRPIAGVNLARLAKATDGYSGADLAHVCESAAELAMMESVRSGNVHPIEMRHLEAALPHVTPSCGPWFDVARNVVMFGDDGTYAELRKYMKKTRRL